VAGGIIEPEPSITGRIHWFDGTKNCVTGGAEGVFAAAVGEDVEIPVAARHDIEISVLVELGLHHLQLETPLVPT